MSMLNSIVKLFSAAKTRRRRRQFTLLPALEKLENRVLLAATMNGGELVIQPQLAYSTSTVYEASLDVTVYMEQGYNPYAGWRFETFGWGFTGVDSIRFEGTSYPDVFVNSTDLPSVADGNGGADVLIGGSGFDQLIGGSGNDRLEGGRGTDVLLGGADSDTYVYSGGVHLGFDQIFDLEGGNRLDFSGLDQPVHVDLSPYRMATRQNPNMPGYNPFDSFGGLVTVDMSYASFNEVIGTRFDDTIIGSDENDWIEGRAGNDTISGNGGSDTIFGGTGDDLIRGGSGNDFLYGGEQNDRLYGESGFDHLYGEAGNDGLFAGIEGSPFVPEIMSGGSGNDRFLYHGFYESEQINSGDVNIYFQDDTSSWTDREIENVDQAFSEIQLKTNGNTSLLKESTSNRPLRFWKAAKNSNWSGLNRTTYTQITEVKRDIYIADWNEYDNEEQGNARATVIHEIAHNWDGSKDEYNPYWTDYTNWYYSSRKYSGSPDFAENYGWVDPKNGRIHENAEEDWATMWEYYFGYGTPRTAPSTAFDTKFSLVNDFFLSHF